MNNLKLETLKIFYKLKQKNKLKRDWAWLATSMTCLIFFIYEDKYKINWLNIDDNI